MAAVYQRPEAGCTGTAARGAGGPLVGSNLLDLDAALDRLDTIDGRLGRLVVLRFFRGLTGDEAAESLDVSVATVKRDWIAHARGCSASSGARPPKLQARTSSPRDCSPRWRAAGA